MRQQQQLAGVHGLQRPSPPCSARHFGLRAFVCKMLLVIRVFAIMTMACEQGVVSLHSLSGSVALCCDWAP